MPKRSSSPRPVKTVSVSDEYMNLRERIEYQIKEIDKQVIKLNKEKEELTVLLKQPGS